MVDTTVTPRRTTAVSGSSLSAVLLLNDKNHIIFSSWDNNIYGLVFLCVSAIMVLFAVGTGCVVEVKGLPVLISFDILFVSCPRLTSFTVLLTYLFIYRYSVSHAHAMGKVYAHDDAVTCLSTDKR